MSGEVFAISNCATACGPLVLSLQCPTTASTGYQLVLKNKVVFTRPWDLTMIGGIEICFDNPLYLGCSHIIDMFALYGGDVPAYLAAHAEYVSTLVDEAVMVLTDINANGTPTGQTTESPVQFGATINQFAYCATFSAITVTGNKCIDLSAFTGCKFVVSFNVPYPLTTAEGMPFSTPPTQCGAARGSAATEPHDLLSH